MPYLVAVLLCSIHILLMPVIGADQLSSAYFLQSHLQDLVRILCTCTFCRVIAGFVLFSEFVMKLKSIIQNHDSVEFVHTFMACMYMLR